MYLQHIITERLEAFDQPPELGLHFLQGLTMELWTWHSTLLRLTITSDVGTVSVRDFFILFFMYCFDCF
jgi:hypothetical protein